MGVEIERRFLVNTPLWKQGLTYSVSSICQGYLTSDTKTVVRIRIEDSRTQRDAYITIKGPSIGASRPEWEYTIPGDEAWEIYANLCSSRITKVRYTWVDDNQKLWYIDEFSGDNQGLIIAEIEIQSENEAVTLPSWLGIEITNDHQYSNAFLAQTPFSSWIKISS